MPADVKPLFRPDALRPKLAEFTVPAAAVAARPKLATWVKLLASDAGKKKKETELLADFLRDVFVDVLGYTPPPTAAYTLKREALVKVDGKFADAGLGRFGGEKDQFVAVLEGKGSKDLLDFPFGGRKLSAVDQALKYAVNTPTDWYLVTNLKEIRLYTKQADQRTYERFELTKLADDDAEFARFVFLLGAERLLDPAGSHLHAVLADSAKLDRELTAVFYDEYRALRLHTLDALRKHNPDRDPARLLAATQKILDRVLFIAFAEDRKLLPGDIIARAYQHSDPFHPRPVWDNFKALFRSVNSGNPALDIWQYNGGLFAADDFLDTLTVPDSVCSGFKLLAQYEYGTATNPNAPLIDVDILGHVFEQSISDLEEMQNVIAGLVAAPKANAKTGRKEAGAFYTPAFVTRYIVGESLGPVLRERLEGLRVVHAEKAEKALAAAHRSQAKEPRKRQLIADAQQTVESLASPEQFVAADLSATPRAALAVFWEEWLAELEKVRVVDPACGSGAFLLEAFDQLFTEYQKAQAFLTQLRGPTLFDIRKTILEHNLYGADLNGGAVSIARLACWIKTAEEGKTLTSLDRNVVQGNSVVSDPAVHPDALDWQQQFPDVFAAGGFDVVIGNPPYVRQEWIKDIKPHLQRHYKAYDGTADLYVYFYELGLNLLKPGGRLGYIVTNKWLKAGYGEPLRKLYGEAAWVEQVSDFGHAKQIFPDADVFPCILIARKPTAGPPPATLRVCDLVGDKFDPTRFAERISAASVEVPMRCLQRRRWLLRDERELAIIEKLEHGHISLSEAVGADEPLSGIKTGYNEAFLIDTATKNRMVAADSNSVPLFRPYIGGKHCDRWQVESSGEWMIAMKSSGNHPWPWAGKPDAEAESLFRQTYPALFAHFDQYRPQLVKRGDRGVFWWELRACAYWDAFDRSKVMYQDITWTPAFSFDTVGTLCNNTVYFLPTGDSWVVAVLNSPLAWWYAWRTAQHGKDEALRYYTEYLNAFPIPSPTDEARARAEELVKRLIDLKGGRTDGLRALLDWLQSEMKVGKVSQKLEGLIGLTAEELAAEVKKQRPGKQGLSMVELKRLKDEYTTSVVPLQTLVREADRLERELSDLVNAAFGLTPAEVQLMWQTAPPRMPFTPC